MYVNHRIHKEPEINMLATSSMAQWNTGQLGQEALAKEKEKLLNPIQVATINKEQNLREIVRNYQESQFYNYQLFLGELGQLGYCTMPIEIPTILEIVPTGQGYDMKADMTYSDYKQRTKRRHDMFDGDNGNPNKIFRSGDGWSGESSVPNKNTDSGWSDDEGGKTTSQNKEQRPHAGWDDEDNKPFRNNKFENRKGSNSATRMQSGWSDEENDQSRNNDRFGEKRNYNDRFERNRGGSDRFFRPRGRGRGRGRGGQWNGNRNKDYDRVDPNNNESSTASGWSDDENKSASKTAENNKIVTKTDTVDDWESSGSNFNQNSLPEKILSTIPNAAPKVDDGWDD